MTPAHAPTAPSTTPQHPQDTPFQRLWLGFLTARIALALTLLLLQALALVFNQHLELTAALVSLAYVAAALLLRWWARDRLPARQPGLHWLPSVGVDILFIGALLWLPQSGPGALNFTPLFGFPVLLAGVLGSLLMALGTTAAVTWLLLASVWWQSEVGMGDSTQRYLEAALISCGYFIIAYLAHLLATRLSGEHQAAHQSQLDARMQQAVSALVVQHAADGVLVIDPHGQVQLANPAALQLLGRSSASEPRFALTDSLHWSPLVHLARGSFHSGQPHQADINILHPGQRPMGLRVRTLLTPVQEPPNNPQEATQERMCVMFLHDLREVEARLRTEKMAVMGRLSAAVAHEIRNPLAAILQANELLDEELSDSMHKRLTRMVRENAERLARITEDILDLARLERQIGQTPSATVPLDATALQILQDWQAHNPSQRQALVQLDAPTVHVEFDAEHLRRVLINLLDNALRYRGEHADSLCLHTRAISGGQTELQVWSDGAPLDKSVEYHLFEPFFSSESRSSGLGLYICRQLCQRHHASIDYQRITRQLPRGEVAGNAFTLRFRSQSQPNEVNSSFDTLVV